VRFEHSTLWTCRKFCGQRRAFTVIEMIGVLTVIALLAAAVIPNLIRRLDRQAWEREKSDLQSMADSYTQFILHNKTVTNYAGIPLAIATEMALPLSAITTTPRGWGRAFLVDPGFSLDGNKSYVQSPSGLANKPAKTRAMIVSSLAGTLPRNSSDSLTDAEFQAIWDTPEGGKPSVAPWDTWTGRGEDLLIKKLNLEPLFYQLILDGGNQAQFSIDNGTTNFVTLTNCYYLDGTILGLYDCSANLQTRYLVQRNISFVFEDCAWRGQIQGAGTRTNTTTSSSSSNFVNRATTFYNTYPNPNAQSGASSISVLVTMYTFMFDYIFWATECPRFDNHGFQNVSTLPEYKMLDDIGQNSTSGSLDDISGQNGILK